MSNTNIREFADQLSDVLLRIEDAKVEASAIIEAAKECGIDTKALRKVAKELVMQSDKLQKRLDDESQMDLFRQSVGLLERKGISEIPYAKTATEATVAYLKESRRIREQAAS